MRLRQETQKLINEQLVAFLVSDLFVLFQSFVLNFFASVFVEKVVLK